VRLYKAVRLDAAIQPLAGGKSQVRAKCLDQRGRFCRLLCHEFVEAIQNLLSGNPTIAADGSLRFEPLEPPAAVSYRVFSFSAFVPG
jgi:hypothetical protein